jgi:TRAP-type mannitol/chloroaromatic compound transport system permease small subunit
MQYTTVLNTIKYPIKLTIAGAQVVVALAGVGEALQGLNLALGLA